jgi:hypothetical protein
LIAPLRGFFVALRLWVFAGLPSRETRIGRRSAHRLPGYCGKPRIFIRIMHEGGAGIALSRATRALTFPAHDQGNDLQ